MRPDADAKDCASSRLHIPFAFTRHERMPSGSRPSRTPKVLKDMKQYKRSDRLAQQILRDISEVMAAEMRETFPGMVTFTHVKLSDDLRYAKVYYSYLGHQDGPEKIGAYLTNEAGRIRSLVGKNLSIRHIPEFLFKYDKSIEHGVRIEQLLNEIRNERENK